MQTDIVVVGAGPAGLSLVRALSGSGLSVALVERNDYSSIAKPAYDGREIALTHASQALMQQYGLWQHLPENEIYPLRDAKVVSGASDFTLHFPQPKPEAGLIAEQLGFLVSNHNIRQAAFNAAEPVENVAWLTGVNVEQVQVADDEATVKLSDGRSLHTRLVVAADSRFYNSIGIFVF